MKTHGVKKMRHNIGNAFDEAVKGGKKTKKREDWKKHPFAYGREMCERKCAYLD